MRPKDYEQTKNKKKTDGEKSTTFFVYHPTQSDKRAMDLQNNSCEAYISAISTAVERDLKVNVFFNQDRGVFQLILRENAESWTKAKALAFFHKDLGRCYQMLIHYMNEVNPEFPDQWPKADFEDDW